MNNIEFFKNQFRKRQLGIKTILREDGPRPLMKNKVLERMIKDNIRGMDPDSAQKEIERLTIINRQLGYSLPEKYRIQKLIYPVNGRPNLDNPVLNISESIDRLGDRLLPKAGNLPFQYRIYQFLIDIAQKQNQQNFRSDEILVVDVKRNIYSIFPDYDSFKDELNATDEDINNFAKRIFINNQIIFTFLDPNKIDELNKLNKYSNVIDIIPDLKNILFGIVDKPLTKQDLPDIPTKEDIKDILIDILKNQYASKVLNEEVLNLMKSSRNSNDVSIFDNIHEEISDEKKRDPLKIFGNFKKLTEEGSKDFTEIAEDIEKSISEEEEEEPDVEPEKDFKDYVLDVISKIKLSKSEQKKYNKLLNYTLKLNNYNNIKEFINDNINNINKASKIKNIDSYIIPNIIKVLNIKKKNKDKEFFKDNLIYFIARESKQTRLL